MFMNDKDEKKTKKADFIDLDKSQFKNAKPYLVYILILLFSVILLLFFSPMIKKIFLNTNKFSDSNNIEVKTNLESPNNDLQEIQPRIYLESKFSGNNSFNVEEVNKQIENSSKKIATLQKKIIELEDKFNEQRNTNSFYDKKIGIDVLLKNDLKFYNFELFKKKLFDGENYEEPLRELKLLFSKNESVTTLLDFFSFKSNKRVISRGQLLSRIDNLLMDSNQNDINREDGYLKDRNVFNSNDTKENLKDYFLALIKSNIKIRKVNTDKNLDDYDDQNNDGVMDFKNVLNKVRDSLITNNLRRAIFLLDSLSSPINIDIEEWLIDAEYLLTIEEKLKILQQAVFKDLIKIDDKNN